MVLEEQLVKVKLQNSSIISAADEAKIILSSHKLSYNYEIKYNTHSSIKQTSDQIQANLGRLFNSTSKEVIIQATKIAVLHNDKFIADHNKTASQYSYIDKETSHYLVYNLALNLTRSHMKGNDISDIKIVSGIKASFDKNIKQQELKIEQQHQVQISKHESKQIYMEL